MQQTYAISCIISQSVCFYTILFAPSIYSPQRCQRVDRKSQWRQPTVTSNRWFLHSPAQHLHSGIPFDKWGVYAVGIMACVDHYLDGTLLICELKPPAKDEMKPFRQSLLVIIRSSTISRPIQIIEYIPLGNSLETTLLRHGMLFYELSSASLLQVGY
jgi:hypothetical protein